MYLGICYSIAEMSPALPHTGGAYSFGRTAMGPWGGFITGLAENVEYILTPAVIVVGIGGYMGSVFNSMFGVGIPAPVWWLLFYVLFVGLNIAGVEATFRFAVLITILALAILMVFWVGAIPHFSWQMALNIEPTNGNTHFLPYGWAGVAQALPFAIWFYLAIEQLPLAAEESHDPKRDMPKALLWGILTLIVASFLTLFLNAGIAPGAAAVGTSDDPLFLAFTTIFGQGIGASVLAQVAVAGLVASTLSFMRQLSHYHLCVRPQHIFALALRLLPTVALADAFQTQNTPCGADWRRRDRILCRTVDRVWRGVVGQGAAGRSCTAEYGGIRRSHRIHHADDRVRPVAKALPVN